ncbi:capsule assembly Wzi family protein [Ekhidna sp.]|uniref:capsule assembly Wzi family protein n=1 Tax=Ekhidna sp. TaxID=2608089 RepID=UPI0032991F38
MKFIYFTILLFLISLSSSAQVFYPGDYTEDYYRVLLIKNPTLETRPIMIRPSIMTSYGTDSVLQWNIWEDDFSLDFNGDAKRSFSILEPRSSFVYNHKYPRGYNNGAVWNGKGMNTSITGGFTGNLGILHFSFSPVLWYAQNGSFRIPPGPYNKSEFSYPVENRIDWVMRFGDDAVHQFDWGQSELRLVYKNFTVGFSTANFSWGPSRYNPIIMSKNAAGFPHIDLGTSKPINTKIGKMEFKWYWGAMYESDYFDENPINDRKYITGLTFGYQPKYLEGLTFGLNRIMYTRWAGGDLDTEDFFSAFLKNSGSPTAFTQNDEYDQLFSVVLEYYLAQVGLNLYIEYARNDFFGGFLDMIEHPDRTRARTIGITKTFDLENGGLFEFNYENTTLSNNQIQVIFPGIAATYYVHSVVENGYTNNGQIVGAGIGPGSNSDILWLNMYRPKGKYGLTVQRIRYNDDYVTETFRGVEDEPTDYEFLIGADYIKMLKDVSLNAQVLAIYRNNFLFEENEKNNFRAKLALTYRIK